MFENAKWIAKKEWDEWAVPCNERIAPCPLFIKDFTLSMPIKSSILNIVGLGQAVYYINGCRLCDSVRPTHPARYTDTVIYNVYDITDLVGVGKNRLGIMLGNIGYADNDFLLWRSNTKMLAQLDITYLDGSEESIVSDKSFKTRDSHVLFSKRLCGEKQDMNLKIKGWSAPEHDADSWDNAVICKAPGGELRTTACPPIREIRSFEPIKIGKKIYDCLENISGFIRLTAKGKKGDQLSIKYAERLNEDGTAVDQSKIICNCGYPALAHRDLFILSGETEVLEQYFTYHGFRYIEIETDAEILSIEAVVTHTDLKLNASFWCDNETLNAIHDICIRSVLTNCQGYLTDCPHREQNPWTGDGMMSSETVNINFDAYGLFYEWMLKFQDDQLKSGGLPSVIPTRNNVWEYNFANGPDWDSAIFFIPYYTYKYSGNREIVDLMWENMCRSLKYFKSLSEDYTIDRGLDDWASTDKLCGSKVTSTTYYRKAALMMAEMAEATGRDSAPFKELAENIKRDFRKVYVKDGKFTYIMQTPLCCAVYGDFLEPEEKRQALSDLKSLIVDNDYRFLCGCHGLVMIFDIMSENGLTEELFKTVVNDKYDGYAKCVKEGLSTLPEHFSMQASLNHHYRSMVDAWFYKELAGIKLKGFGYSGLVIEPKFVSGIKKLKATVKGISVEYNEKELRVNSPYDFTLILKDKSQKLYAGEYTVEL